MDFFQSPHPHVVMTSSESSEPSPQQYMYIPHHGSQQQEEERMERERLKALKVCLQFPDEHSNLLLKDVSNVCIYICARTGKQ